MISIRIILCLFTLPWTSSAFAFQSSIPWTAKISPVRMSSNDDSSAAAAAAATKGKQITVIGGTGFVGSKVCELLAGKGVDVTSVSKSGNIPAWCADEDWTKQVKWIATDLEIADENAIDAAVGSPNSLVSCLGVIGTDPDKLMKGNGAANCAAFASAKRGGNIQCAVFVSVSSEVVACQDKWLPDFFKGYFDGKLMAEECALDAVDGDNSRVSVVKPTFIYGGDSFGLIPPRVTSEYGSLIEELLSLGLFKILADVTPGLIKVALRPPSSVEAVAEACVSAALEGPALGKVLEGAAEINDITNQPAATGLTDAIEWLKLKTSDAVEWTKEEVVPKLVAKVEELQQKK